MMSEKDIIKVQREPNWLPPFRVEYDGKYITLFGRDKNYEFPWYGGADSRPEEPDYDEMVLVPVVLEMRELSPLVESFTDTEVIINLHAYDRHP